MLSHYWELNIVDRNSNSVGYIFLLSFQFVLMFLSVCEMLGLFPFQKDASPTIAESPNFLPLPYSPALWIYIFFKKKICFSLMGARLGLLFCLWDRVSWNPGWLLMYYVAEDGFELPNPPVSASQVLVFQAFNSLNIHSFPIILFAQNLLCKKKIIQK